MSGISGGAPPSLTTIDALLSLKDFINSPESIARVQELRAAEVSANTAQTAAAKQVAKAQSLLDEHASKVAAHEEQVAALKDAQAALKRQQDLLARKMAKMREAENL